MLDALKELGEDLEGLCSSLEHDAKRGARKVKRQVQTEVKGVKRQLRKEGIDVDDTIHEVKGLASRAQRGLNDFVEEVTGNKKSVSEEVIQDVRRQAEKVSRDIDQVIKNSSPLLKELNEVLKVLKETISSAFKELGKIFKSVFSSTPKKPTFTSAYKHQKPPSHLEKDKAMEKGQRHAHHTPSDSRNTRLGIKGKGKG